MSKVDALKQFFSSEKRPVTTKELTDFKKADPAGFEELANAVVTALTPAS